MSSHCINYQLHDRSDKESGLSVLQRNKLLQAKFNLASAQYGALQVFKA